MLQPHLIHQILYEPWAIMPEWVSAYSHLIENLFNPNLAFDQASPDLPQTIAFTEVDNGVDTLGAEDATQLQVIKLVGALTKYDQRCGPAGMLSLAGWIRNAADNHQVNAIVLRIDSPGGMVAGTETLVDAIAYARAKKPVIGFVDDLAASAAYWSIAGCTEVIANNTTAQIGSIGVVSSWVDMQPVLEKQGAKFHTILAPQSVNKTRMMDQIRAGNYDEYKEQVLRPIAQKFIDSVRALRPGITDEHTRADVFFAKDVVGSLVDSIGSFDFALQRAAVLAKQSSKKTPIQATSNSTINMSKPDFNRLAKAAGVPQLESADGTITLTAELAQSVESALAAHETNNASIQQQLNERANQQARITELEQQLQQRDARIAELEQGAGAASASAATETDATASADDATDFWSISAKLNDEFNL